MTIHDMSASRFKFSPGHILATPGAMHLAEQGEIGKILMLHLSGLWGDLNAERIQANDDALTHGNRILSAYNLKRGKVWVITEADRRYTTILLPEEY